MTFKGRTTYRQKVDWEIVSRRIGQIVYSQNAITEKVIILKFTTLKELPTLSNDTFCLSIYLLNKHHLLLTEFPPNDPLRLTNFLLNIVCRKYHSAKTQPVYKQTVYKVSTTRIYARDVSVIKQKTSRPPQFQWI